jgi:proline iminopeptidase
LPPIPEPPRSGFTTTTDTPLYWVGYGESPSGEDGLRPPILLLHGGPGASHDYLLPQMLRLADGGPLYLYDQRGGGRSRDQGEPPTWRTHVEDVGRVVVELGVEPLDLVGYSWGALLAMLYTLEAIEGRGGIAPRRLVLISPAPIDRNFRSQFEAEFTRRQKSAEVQRLRDELAASGLRDSDPDAYRQRGFELSVAGYFADPARAHDLTPFRVIARAQQSVWESLGDYDLSGRLTSISVPTLIVHGREDPIPVESAERAAEAIGARLVVLEQCGHVPYVECPEPLFEAIGAFLSE